MQKMNFYESTVDEKLSFYICDTTLRDGEQVAGIRYTPEQKTEIAVCLDRIGIESMDAGFAATSEEERVSIRKICSMGLKIRVMSMCRVIREDVEHAISCGVDGVILFIPGSDIHLKAKFSGDISSTRERLINNSVDMIRYAKDKGLFVEFGIEDATRTEYEVLLEIFSKAEEAGADALGTTDTIGCYTPEKTYAFINSLTRCLQTPIGVHCHNDFGLATANTIAGILAGGGYCSPTVNGFGERAGNASLEEVIMAMNVLYKQDLPYDTQKLSELSYKVEKYSGVSLDIFKPIVGANAYSHESGIHIHGMLKDVNTYEVFNPQVIGRNRKYVLGKHAGKHLIQHILKEHGLDVMARDAEGFWLKMKEKEKLGIHYTEEDIVNEFEGSKQ